jgi:RND family efflux transporter MFP subunit
MSVDNQHVDLSALRINRSTPVPPSGGGKAGKYLIIGICMVALAGGYYYFSSNNFSFSSEEIDEVSASLTSPSQGNAVLTASGYVVAQRKASVSSKATGRLASLYAIEGDQLKQGAVIGRIESSDVEASLAQAQASVEVAKANLQNSVADLEDAKVNADRQRSLHGQGASSTQDLTNAETRMKRAQAAVASSEASVKVAEANVRSAQVQVENTYIRAPFDGTVLNKNANVGEVITSLGGAAGSRGAVVTLADMSSLEVEADVSESNIERIKPNQQCEITLDAFPEKRYRGYLSKIIPTADRAKATVLTKVRFSERDERVLPEMSAKVLFLKDNTSVESDNLPPRVTVPASSVVRRNGKKVVFVVRNSKAIESTVEIGEEMGGLLEIKSGLSAGDKVVKNPSEKMTSGTSVTLKK